MNNTYLAQIIPIEPYANTKYAKAKITFVTGTRAGSSIEANVCTDIYRYYFFGSAFQAVTVDEYMNIVNVEDVDLKWRRKFNIKLLTVVAYNNVTANLVVQTGRVYNLYRSLFYKYCPQSCENIIATLRTCFNAVLRVYVIDDSIVEVLCKTNVVVAKNKEYVLQTGMVAMNVNLLGKVTYDTPVINGKSANDPLNQKEIDELLERINNTGTTCTTCI